ncbi:MAG: nucleotide exchange factor GrpE [Rhodospirillales bacterium]|nr:nucleotide exchange factor GrpE [Rhodospirillales bacterium]
MNQDKNEENEPEPEEQSPEDAIPTEDAPEDVPGETPEEDVPGDEAPQEAPDNEAGPPLEEQVAELNDKLLRALAEAENVRRRAERDREDASKYAITNFARDMLAVADNTRRAMDSVDADQRKNDAALEQLMVGLELVERELLATFERFNIKTIEAIGEKFDHNLHEAMFEMEDPSKPAGTVVQEMERGYVLHDRLLRPAKVGISKGGPKAASPNTNETADEGQKDGKPEGKNEGRAAYEDKGKGPGAQLDEEL